MVRSIWGSSILAILREFGMGLMSESTRTLKMEIKSHIYYTYNIAIVRRNKPHHNE